MALKKIATHPIDNDAVSVTQLRKLLAHYYQQMKKKKGTLNRDLDPKTDTIAAWFWKQRVDELFVANGYNDALPPDEKQKFGLRVYYGVHDKGSIITSIPDTYDNQQMVVLVVTKFNGSYQEDLITDGHSVEIAGLVDTGLAGFGLDNGKLCPPDTGCEGSTLRLELNGMITKKDS